MGHLSKFQRVSRLGFLTAATSLTGGQPKFARCLAVSCAGTLYIHFGGGLLPLTEFCQLQYSRYVQVLRSPILAALLHGTPAADVSQTLFRGKRNGVTELSQRAPPIFGWASAHILVYIASLAYVCLLLPARLCGRAVLAIALCPSVCLSVCLSQVGVLSKRLHGRIKLFWRSVYPPLILLRDVKEFT